METVEIRWFAAAGEAAGQPRSTVTVEPGTSVSDVLAGATRGNERLARIVAASSLLADGRSLTDREAPLGAERLDVLPPFAGG